MNDAPMMPSGRNAPNTATASPTVRRLATSDCTIWPRTTAIPESALTASTGPTTSNSAPPPLIPLTAAPPPLIPLTAAPPPLIPLTAAPPPLIPLTAAPPPLIPLTAAPPPLIPLTAAPPPLIPLTAAPPPLIPADTAVDAAKKAVVAAIPNVFIIEKSPKTLCSMAFGDLGLRGHRFPLRVTPYDCSFRRRARSKLYVGNPIDKLILKEIHADTVFLALDRFRSDAERRVRNVSNSVSNSWPRSPATAINLSRPVSERSSSHTTARSNKLAPVDSHGVGCGQNSLLLLPGIAPSARSA